MKELFQFSLRTFGRIFVANFLSIFLIISFNAAFTGLAASRYDVYGYKDGMEQQVKLYSYEKGSGDDTLAAEYEEQGYTLSRIKVLSKRQTNALNAVNLVFGAGMVFLFLYPSLWQLGARDNNKVHFHRMEEDKGRGLKIGLIAEIPFFLFYLFVGICALGAYPGFSLAIYKFINAAFFSYYTWIFGSALAAGDLSVWRWILALFPLAVIPVMAWLSYWLGFKGISVEEKLIYKKDRKK